MTVALLAPVGEAARVWALPFSTALCPSKRYAPYVRRARRHNHLPERALLVGADSSYAALESLAWCARQARPVAVITRLRLDAALYGRPRAAPCLRAANIGVPKCV